MIIEDHQKQISAEAQEAGAITTLPSKTRGTKMLQRVKKQDTKTDSWVKPEPVDYCLEIWKNWMAGDNDRDLGVKTTRGLRADGEVPDVDLYEAQQASDLRIALATEAMISSLDRVYVWSLYRSCGISTVWNFPTISLLEAADHAKAQLREKLRRNVCTALLF